ncbi:MAG: hypothetical protein RJQ09_05800 [Cyclobacteriaceae bacterium]
MRIIATLVLVCFVISAESQETTPDEQAVIKADQMFEAIGGKKKWASLKSLYIKAVHTQPNLTEPYTSEIWRSIDGFKIRIEQKSDEFHKVGMFSDEGVWIRDLKAGTVKQLDEDRLTDEKRQNELNVYVLLNRIARNESYKPKLNGQRLEFYLNEEFQTAFILDEYSRPSIFITKSKDGLKEFVSFFNKWGTTNGFIHSAGGGPVDGNFFYSTEIWQPSELIFEEAFDVAFSTDTE